MSSPPESSQLISLIRQAIQDLGYITGDVNYKALAPNKWIEAYAPDLELKFEESLSKAQLVDSSTIKIVLLALNQDGKNYNQFFIARHQPHKQKSARILLSHNQFADREVASKAILNAPVYIIKPKNKKHKIETSELFSLSQQVKKGNSTELSIAAFMVNTFSLIIPFFISIYFDLIIPNQASATLITLCVGVFIMLIFDLLFKKARTHISEKNSLNYEKKLDAWLYDKLFSDPGSFYKLGKRAMRTMPSDLAGMNEVNSSRFVLPFFDLIFSVIFIIAIALIGGEIVAISIICLVVALINGYRGAKIYMRLDDSRRQSSGMKNAFYNNLVSGYEVMSNTLAHESQKGRFLNLTAAVAEVNSAMRKQNLQVSTFVQFLTQLQTILILVIGFYMVMNGNLSGGNLFAIMLLSGRLATSFSAIYTLLTLYYRYQATLADTVRTMKSDMDDKHKNLVRTLEKGTVQLNKVLLNIEGRPLLNGISVTIKAGEKVALIGEAGSGKTILTQLIGGFYRPTSGELLLSGISTEHIHASALAQHITYIPRDPVIFANSVHANLVSSPEQDLSQNKVFQELCGFVAKLPNGLATQVGGDNYHLSFSESRAITLARGLINKSALLLMDEPDNGLDDKWIDHLKQAIGSIKDTNVIATITNKALLNYFDRIIIMEKGQIVHSFEPKNS